MRFCKYCNKDKLLNEFPFKSIERGLYQNKCKECQRAYSKLWHINNNIIKPDYVKERNARMVKINREVIRKYKEDNPCKDCGNYYAHYVMEFDHLRDKFKNIARMISENSIKRILQEIEKCDLVCSNCHAIRTWTRSHIAPLV